MNLFTRPLVTAVAAGGVLASLLAAQPVSACGGFFCNNSQPVNQAAERILFSVAEDGTVTATIQIQYSGDAESFAWVLPVTGSPEVRVSSDLAFTRLQSATNPSYVLTTRVEGSCAVDDFASPVAGGDAGSFSDAAAVSRDTGPVSVVSEGNVGPYDFVVITVDPAATRPTDAAVAWLGDNGYQIDEGGASRLEPYVSTGMNLLAFRLTKGNSTGSIRPVQITFGPGAPSIPIRPTAVAAVADMGVMVWVLGPHRAVPVNYASLELNEALINWLNPTPTYNDVVTEAADQAGGQGFVTELAGDPSPLGEAIFSTFERGNWDALRGQDWTAREGELFVTALSSFAGFDGLRDVVASTFVVPEGATVSDVVQCPNCFVSFGEADIARFEPADFLAALETQVIEPMDRTRLLFEDAAYVTRLYTTMSASEMTRDPIFDFNADLGDVSATHNAERVIECSPSIRTFEAPWRVELANGETVRGTGFNWPFAARGSLPANARIVRYETTGAGETVVDNGATIRAALTDHNGTIPTPVRTTPPVRDPGDACSVSHGAGSPSIVSLLGLAGLLLALRRRGR